MKASFFSVLLFCSSLAFAEVDIIAHRGNSCEAPENTLSAFRQACILQSDFMECDVHLTKDGVPVVIHDRILFRTTNTAYPIAIEDLTLEQLENYFMSIFLTRVDEGNRKIVVSTGSLGHKIFDQLISEEVSQFLTLDRYYVQPMAGGSGSNDLQYGYQFKKFISKNGLEVSLQSNPMLDDPFYCPRRYPNNPIYTVDSARMDIMDFGAAGSSMAPGASNMSMLKEAGVDSYYLVGGVVDPQQGVVTDGSFRQNPMKEVIFRREKSAGLQVWDTSRIGSIILEPNL